MVAVEPLDAEYILPLRWSDDSGLDELSGYLRRLSGWIAVTVVDGSAPHLFDAHSVRWAPAVGDTGDIRPTRHIRPEPWRGQNGKVAGVMTGVAHARHERLVLADDDVRYERAELARLVGMLGEADIVRPQNFFLSLPWHAKWDTARSLLNRAAASDYPGTLGVRRSILLASNGYDGDVLFENLELIRTVRAVGGRERRAPDLFVGRLPPTKGHFLAQRVRYAYDDFAQPARLCLELALLPLILCLRHRPLGLAALVLAVSAAAEAGRRRNGGRTAFPPTTSLWAPLWLGERAVCVWIAIGWRLMGGVPYAGRRIRRAGTAASVLRRRFRATRRARTGDHE